MAICKSFSKLDAWHPLVQQNWAIRKSFLRENCIFTNLQKFSSSKVSCYMVCWFKLNTILRGTWTQASGSLFSNGISMRRMSHNCSYIHINKTCLSHFVLSTGYMWLWNDGTMFWCRTYWGSYVTEHYYNTGLTEVVRSLNIIMIQDLHEVVRSLNIMIQNFLR